MQFPYCAVTDVQAKNPHRDTYGSGTKPTSTQVTEFIQQIAAHLRAVASDAGYDVDNFHETSDTVALAVTAGSNVDVVVTDADNFTAGDAVFVYGTYGGALKTEFANVIVVTPATDTIRIDVLANSYAAASVHILVLNDALRTLKRLNAIGAAAMAEETAFMGISPNKSDHAEKLWEQYRGSEKTLDGLWAIQNIPEFLIGATETTGAASSLSCESYGEQHSTDSDVEPTFEIDQEF
jgi:hypothetical protein